MKVLILGSGGREHALVWKISQSPKVDQIYCIPGNGGICQTATCYNIPLNDFTQLAEFVEQNEIDLTIVGPEQPLVGGIVDFFQDRGLRIFGPNKAAARMEGSKIFAKRLMQKYGIPTAGFEVFEDYEAARQYLDSLPEKPIVVKADGLAAGKGSVVCATRAEAQVALREMMKDKIFQEAGSRVVLEEFMRGEEASLFIITDGKDFIILPPAQDFKRALDGDQGKNTGGMGSYAPTPVLSDEQYQQAISRIVEPTLQALRQEGIDYQGVLYCGLMLTEEGPKVVEFNCRFGDPETQVVLPLLKTDLLEICNAVVDGNLKSIQPEVASGYAVCVVLASGGYPGSYQKGKKITGLDTVPSDVLIFHAGTTIKDSEYFTAGGRVLNVVATAPELYSAIEKVYRAVEFIHFDKMHYRKDIARRALKYFNR